MFDGLLHSIRLRCLQAQKRGTTGKYKELRRQALEQKKDREYLERLSYEEMRDVSEWEDEILQIHSQYLVNQAEKYLLPIPKFQEKGGDWEQSPFLGLWRLNKRALADLQAAIRKEQKESREHWRAWTASITGLIGALIGLVTLLTK